MCCIYFTIGIFASFLILYCLHIFFRKVMGRPLSNEVYELLLSSIYMCTREIGHAGAQLPLKKNILITTGEGGTL